MSISASPPVLNTTKSRPVVLGSTSRYRRELMERLRIPFSVAAPDVDETPATGESPRDPALRLALAKAKAVAALHPTAVVIEHKKAGFQAASTARSAEPSSPPLRTASR